jgi:pyruvate/2-oxoglutarate dehydrogenase complex dihydrolipoamide acyltransferase (E2) component
MSKHTDTYRVVPFPHSRKLVIDSMSLGRRKHIMHGLIDIDITHTRQAIRAYRARTGAGLSLTAFVIACLGKAIEADKTLHAYRNGRNQLVLFDEVDVTTIIETQFEGRSFPLAHIIRAVNRRTAQDIDREIQMVRAHPESSPSLRQWRGGAWFVRLPALVRHLVYRLVFRNPHTIKRTVGTVMVTAVGMFGVGSGWGIGLPNYTLTLTLGGTSKKPGVVQGQIAIRDYLSITISIDHAIVDGAPAARFVRRLKQLIERADGLDTE